MAERKEDGLIDVHVCAGMIDQIVVRHGGELLRRGVERLGQFSPGIDITKQDVGKRLTPELPAVPRFDDCVGLPFRPCKGNRTPVDKDDDNIGVHRGHLGEQIPLNLRQFDFRAVQLFPGDGGGGAKNENYRIVSGGDRLCRREIRLFQVPRQSCTRAEPVIILIEFNVISFASLQLHRGAVGGLGVVSPIVYHELPIDIQPRTIIRACPDMMHGHRRNDPPSPPDGKMIHGYAGSRRAGAEIEIHHGIDARECRCAGQVHVVKILPLHTGFAGPFNLRKVPGLDGAQKPAGNNASRCIFSLHADGGGLRHDPVKRADLNAGPAGINAELRFSGVGADDRNRFRLLSVQRQYSAVLEEHN